MNKHRLERLVTGICLAATMIVPGPAIAAPAATASTGTQSADTLYVDSNTLTADDQHFLKSVAASAHTFVDRDGVIATTATDEELASNYGFTDDGIIRLHNSVLGKPLTYNNTYPDNPYINLVHVEGGAVCFSHTDLVAGVGATIVAADAAGPAAIAAALEAIASALGGPIGTVIGGILVAASVPTLLEIGGRAVTAVATNRGLKIGVHADYPPVYADYC